MKKTFLLPLAALCLPLVLLAPACDQASPVAPAGTVLSITASPSRIDANGTSSVRVTALKANGTSVNPGTEIRLDTTLGTITSIAATDSTGVAEATLRGDGRVGMATVTARTGAAEAATVDVEIGEFARSITLQATPSQVGPGERVDLLALVRDDEGRPLSGANVNFQSQVGTLASGGRIKITDASGAVTDRLTVSQDDIDAFNQPSFNVTATVGTEGGDQEAITNIRIREARPSVVFFPTAGGGNRVFFRNETTGEEPIVWEWDFTSDGTIDSGLREPTFDYGSAASGVRVTLRATNSAGEDTAICTIDVPVSGSPRCASE